jgi:predicted transcriptional regulator of viral defense system
LASNFFSLVQMRKLEVIKTGEAASALGLSPAKEKDLFRRLTRTGWIVRLQRGLYLVPKILPAGGRWNPSESVVLPALMKAIKGQYQISGPTAFNKYGFDDQVANSVFVYNDRLSGTRQIGSTQYVFIRVAKDRLGEAEKVKTPDGGDLYYSSRPRTLVDALYDWSRFNGIPRGFSWIRQNLQKGTITAGELARITVRFGNQSTLRRLGLVLEKEGVSASVLKTVKNALNKSKAQIALVPSRSRKGRIAKAWGVIDNE